MGMKVELVRTDEENERYRQLVETNRQRRRQLLEQEQQDQLVIPQVRIIFLLTVHYLIFLFRKLLPKLIY
jgi:hypothetical protein